MRHPAIVGAYALCCAFYIPAGIFGYYTFGSGTISDLLSTSDDPSKVSHSYSVSAKRGLVARICLAAVATCGVPLNHFPARIAVYSLYNKIFQPVRRVTRCRVVHEVHTTGPLSSLLVSLPALSTADVPRCERRAWASPQ